MAGFWIVVPVLLVVVSWTSGKRPDTVYMNQFAVHVPAGDVHAKSVADKHGFRYMGQIGSLKGYYLFEHNHVRKRSTERSLDHHEKLLNEDKVHWVSQQYEKRRVKRDYEDYDADDDLGGPSPPGGGYRPYFRPPPRHSLLHPQYSRGITPFSSFPDPLYKEQWYLNGGAKDGFDMNVEPAWKKGYSGKGIVVSILDDGIQTNHPDLAQNYDSLASTDINDNDEDPMPRDNGDNKHGTRCAGEVAGVAFNGFCGVGVAYNASIGGVRMLDGTVNDAVEARALGLNPDHVDVYSASWGPEDDGKTVDGPGPLARRAFIYGITNGRKGKGSIFVWASGNGGRHTDNCNCDGYTNSIFTLSISSATQGGQKPWYLEECSSTLATTYSSGTPGHDKSVATVDMDGKLRPDHICTVEHTGTSASAPLAAGICALGLEANTDLTWRDMQYLVVMTSRPDPLDKEGGWTMNGVNRKVSHKFGYGLMDAEGMVSLAEQWITVPPQHICKSQEITEERVIPGMNNDKLKVYMDLDGCAGTMNEVRFLEHVQCKISLRFFPRGNLRVLLTSPMGTTSILLFERPRDVISSNFDEWPFLSVHFWGERAEGRWTLEIINSGSRRINQPGVLKKWQLILYGADSNPVRLRSRTNGNSGFPSSSPLSTKTLVGAAASRPPPTQASGLGGLLSSSPGYRSNSNFHDFSNLFQFSGSNVQESVMSPNAVTRAPKVEEDPNFGKEIMYKDCHPECQRGCYGTTASLCRRCKNFKFNGTCVSECPQGTFTDHYKMCVPCHETCQMCVGAGIADCLECIESYLMVTDMSICMQECPQGYFQDSEKKQCISCAALCGSCEGQPNHCTSCDHNLVLFEGQCYATCPPHTFETGDYNCQGCHSSCATCTGPADHQCVTCPSGRYFFENHCLDSCPMGYYPEENTNECIHCREGCRECNRSGCLSCEDGWESNLTGTDSYCLPRANPQCMRSEYYDGNVCKPCHASCTSCTGASLAQCLSCPSPLLLHYASCIPVCPDGYFAESDRCLPCPKTCSQCVAHDNCTRCVEGLHLEGGTCRASCSNGFYSDLGMCRKCYVACGTCSGPRKDQCVTCPQKWQLAAGECHPECPIGFFKSTYGCQKCHRSCNTCKGDGPLDCTSCHPGYMLEGSICMECGEGQFYEAATMLCKPCHSTCRTCVGPEQFSCKSCHLPLQFDMLNSQCVPCCEAGNEDNCCTCNPDTGHCKNPSPAGKRRIGSDEPKASWVLSNEHYSHLPFASMAIVAICACVAVVILFTVIFGALQARSSRLLCWKRQKGGYEKLAIRPQYRTGVEKVSLSPEAHVADSEEEDEADEDQTLFTRT